MVRRRQRRRQQLMEKGVSAAARTHIRKNKRADEEKRPNPRGAPWLPIGSRWMVVFDRSPNPKNKNKRQKKLRQLKKRTKRGWSGSGHCMSVSLLLLLCVCAVLWPLPSACFLALWLSASSLLTVVVVGAFHLACSSPPLLSYTPPPPPFPPMYTQTNKQTRRFEVAHALHLLAPTCPSFYSIPFTRSSSRRRARYVGSGYP